MSILMEKATTAAFWQQVRHGEEYRALREQITAIYSESRMDSIPVLDFALRMRFYEDGDRAAFEDAYFRRRHFLASAALLALIYPEEKTYIQEVQACIWAICEEYTWAIPAHCGADANDTKTIDLFAAETAFTLAEISYLLGNRLHPFLLERIKAEVTKRIIHNYDTMTFWWMKTPYNWAAVCAGNVGGALLYLFPEELEKRLPRLLETLRGFIAGFPADGTCLEGVSYWDYGFGNFACFAELLFQHTDGKINLFSWDNVENIAGYLQRMFLQGHAAVSFSDGSPDAKADRGLQNLLREKFPGKLSAIDPACCTYNTATVMWRPAFRNFCYLEKDTPTAAEPKDYFLPDAGQVVVNRARYSLAAKAGHNNEPHNHNDVGTFILSTDAGQVLCDLGSGLYTRDYFRPETRYNHFCTASAGHSVPIIDGCGQKPGKDYRGTISYAEGVIHIDFAGAYGIAGLTRLERTIDCRESTVALTDTFDLPFETFTERFITRFAPEITVRAVKIAGVTMEYDPAKCTPKVQQVQCENRAGQQRTAYILDFDLQKGVQQVTFTFHI